MIKKIYYKFKNRFAYLTYKPLATREEYLSLHKICKLEKFSIIDDFETSNGFQIDKDYFEELALHTQVCIKKSKLNYQHGRILYSVLSNYLKKNSLKEINIIETGTARGFSSICMSKAINDSRKKGIIHTCDIIPHNKKIYWNCIDDTESKKTRKELLNHWEEELKNIKFYEGKSKKMFQKINVERFNFVFLDAVHSYEDVIEEFNYVQNKQKVGDIIVFDDVTASLFPGVVKAVKEVEKKKKYSIEHINISQQRGYAIAQKIL